MHSFKFYISLLLTIIVITSCGSDPEPNEIFIGTYTAQKFCDDDESFTSQITPGTIGTEIIWNNAAGEDGSEDDLKGTITGNSISLSKQNIGGNLEMSASGSLQDNGNIQMNTIIYAGPIQVSCSITFTPQ